MSLQETRGPGQSTDNELILEIIDTYSGEIMTTLESLEALVVEGSTTGDAFSASNPPRCAVFIETILPRDTLKRLMSMMT